MLIHPTASRMNSSGAIKPLPEPACIEKKAARANGPQRPDQLCARSSNTQAVQRAFGMAMLLSYPFSRLWETALFPAVCAEAD